MLGFGELGAKWSAKTVKRFVSSRRTTAEVSACLTRERRRIPSMRRPLAHGIAEGQIFIEGKVASRPFRILMSLMKATGEEESVHFHGERLLDVG